MLVPKLVTTLRGYTREQLFTDLTAGVILRIVALPLAIAFATAGRVSPERALYTAIISGFLILALGSSRVQIGGPTGAFVVIVYAIVQQHGVAGLAVATVLAGIILVGFGLAGLGGAIKFIRHPVTIGFTSGIALIIFSSQVKDFLGLRMGTVPASFTEKWQVFLTHLDSVKGEENIHGNIDDALNRARGELGLSREPRPSFATPTVAREGSSNVA